MVHKILRDMVKMNNCSWLGAGFNGLVLSWCGTGLLKKAIFYPVDWAEMVGALKL